MTDPSEVAHISIDFEPNLSAKYFTIFAYVADRKRDIS
jgi:hypothetical protein